MVLPNKFVGTNVFSTIASLPTTVNQELLIHDFFSENVENDKNI